MLEYPLLAEKEGIKIRPELMEVDRLYHCVFENAVFIFYKDQEEIMHCYQVDNSDAIKEIVARSYKSRGHTHEIFVRKKVIQL